MNPRPPSPAPRPLPSGTVTFLFTDIEGSTPLLQAYPVAMPRALTRHHEILQQAIAAHDGHIFQIIGDAFCAAFGDARQCLAAALEAQHALHAERWGEIGMLRVRMGLHTGAAEVRGDDYVSSLTLVRVQRIMSAAHGGQTLLSSVTAELVREQMPSGTTLRDIGTHKLRGLTQPELIFQVVSADLPSEFAPLRVVESADAQDSTALLEQLVRGKLIGRSNELAQLQAHWNTALQARAHLVLLSGEPGVGKTRLANELIAHAQNEGAELLRGGCYEYEATTPYLPFVEAFRDWVHGQSADTLRDKLGSNATEIAKLAPEIESKLGALPPNPALPPNEERLRFFDHVARFLQTIAAPRGLLFFVDDLHWADQGTLNLLHYLLRHLRNDRVLILAAYREVELDRSHPLAAALVEWNREHLATRVSLSRLSRADTGTLIATLFGQGSISEEFVEVLFRETEGNPFFIEEVIKSLIEQGEIYREDGGWGRKQVHELAVPQSVKEAIGRRLNRLSANAVEVLRTAAALGKIFRFGELAAVAATPEDQLLDALDEASAAQLLRPNSDDTFAFTHDKIREVLYEEVNPIRRRRLHQRIGEKLEQIYLATPNAGVRIQDLAHHFIESGDLARALTYARGAAEKAAKIFAHDEALSYFERAREAAEALGQEAALGEIYEAMGDLYSLRGVVGAAVEHYEHAVTLARSKEQRGALHSKIGRDYAQVGDARGAQFLEMALTELDATTQTNQLALATAALGRYHHYRSNHHRALEFLERARALAEPLDDADTLNYVYMFTAGAYQHLGRVNQSMEWARKAKAMGEQKHFPLAISTGNEFLAEDTMLRGHWREALEYARLDRREGERIGAQDRIAWSGYITAWTRHGMGELAHAETEARAALSLAETIGDLRLRIMDQALLGQILSDRGQMDEARSQGAIALARSDELKHIVIQSLARQGLAYVELNERNWARALALLEESAALLAPTDNQWMRLTLGPILAEAYWGMGRYDEARDTVYEARATAQFAGSAHWEAWALRMQGQILTSQEEFDTAERAFEQAITIFESLGSRLQLAHAYFYRAAMWRARGDMDHRAGQDEQTATELFRECGAVYPQSASSKQS